MLSFYIVLWYKELYDIRITGELNNKEKENALVTDKLYSYSQ